MKKNILFKKPACKKEDLGKSIPKDLHAVSVCLPTWQNIIDYEERSPNLINSLCTGYPRFIYHPYVKKTFEKFIQNTHSDIQLYPTEKSAQRAKSYLNSKFPKEQIVIKEVSNIYKIEFSKLLSSEAMNYWQHTGEGISSRQACAIFSEKKISNIEKIYNSLQDRVAEVYDSNKEDIYLFPSGMAAIYMSMLVLKKIFPEQCFAQFSFPYGDTLKLLEKFNKKEPYFFPKGDKNDLINLEEIIKRENISGLFTEMPSNPLLTSVDLHQLRILANKFHFPLIVDETLSACINTNVKDFSDISTISLTKYFSGEGNVMGGALILNPNQPFYYIIKPLLDEVHEKKLCFSEDLSVIIKNSKDLKDRVKKINKNTISIVNFLRNHKAIKSVYYPDKVNNDLYKKYKKSNGGYGGVLSFILNNPERTTPIFYDNLKISKGPNLGTSYSLCCPFIMLAHYNELAWAEKMGASRWLIRLSIGMESPNDVIKRIEAALNISM